MVTQLNDSNLLLPIVEKTTILYTKYNIKPNTITLFNGFIISNFIIYCWINCQYLLSTLFLFIRLILDGADGMIARKYNLQSKKGEIYDHVGDSIFIGYILITLCHKLHIDPIFTYLASHTVMLLCLIINFEEKLTWLGEKVFGAGGNYSSYCTIHYLLLQLTILAIDMIY